jgi:hypothetical protein
MTMNDTSAGSARGLLPKGDHPLAADGGTIRVVPEEEARRFRREKVGVR